VKAFILCVTQVACTVRH